MVVFALSLYCKAVLEINRFNNHVILLWREITLTSKYCNPSSILLKLQFPTNEALHILWNVFCMEAFLHPYDQNPNFARHQPIFDDLSIGKALKFSRPSAEPEKVWHILAYYLVIFWVKYHQSIAKVKPKTVSLADVPPVHGRPKQPLDLMCS